MPSFVHDDIAKKWTDEPVRHAVKHVTVIPVVSVAITGVALAFLVRIHHEFGTTEEASLLEQVRR